jgi:hypothetical protein
MYSTDALVILVDAFPLDGILTDTQGNLAHLFSGDFSFAATETGDHSLRLSAELSGLTVGAPDIARRMLEANLAGVETGAGAMAPDPVGSGHCALVETLALEDMDADDFRLRFVDFMLFVEYWRGEGVAEVLTARQRDLAARADAVDAVMVRA